jgi:hypothetical protein
MLGSFPLGHSRTIGGSIIAMTFSATGETVTQVPEPARLSLIVGLAVMWCVQPQSLESIRRRVDMSFDGRLRLTKLARLEPYFLMS